MRYKAFLSKWLIAAVLLTIIAPALAGRTASADAESSAVTASVYENVYYDNLASGKTPSVSLISGDAAQTAKEAAMAGRLTDGVLGDGDWNGHRTLYVDFYRNIGRHVIVDLGEVSTVKELNFRAMQDTSAGIYFPQSVGFSLSNDGGKTWTYLGSVPADQVDKVDAKAGVFRFGGLNYQANKVRISFPVDVWIFADELQIMGKKGIVDGAAIPAGSDFDPYEEINAYPAPGSAQTRGAVNDYLVYAGWHTNGTIRHDKTKDMLLPAVAYIDPSKQIKDMMFDSFTFLPYATASSGRSYFYKNGATANQVSNKQDWQEYIDFLFNDQNQLAALNAAVGEAKSALSRPDYQGKVKIAIPNPVGAQNAFGTIDGVDLNFNQAEVGNEQALTNRVKAVKWYVDQILQRWDPAKYPNLRLDGFYWLDEAIHYYVDNLEESLVMQAIDYIHQQNKIIHWIPFYQASGFEKWKYYGFDYAVMQPNYAFQDAAPVTRPTDTALLAKRYGLGVEMELRNITNEADRQKYYQYVYQGTTAGYMKESVRGWYLGNLTLQDAYNSTDPAQRDIYEMTYKSVKGSFPKAPEQLASNLAYGKTPVLSLISGDQPQTDKEKAMIGRLTDNVFGNGDWSKNRDKYIDFYRNIGRSIIVDLGQTSTVNEVSLRVMQDAAAGIGMPSNVSFSLSGDGGQTWQYIGSVASANTETIDAKHKAFKLSGLNYIANRVKIGFDVSVWAFVDELEVIGRHGIADGATEAPDLGFEDPYKETNAFPAPGSDEVWGTRNDYLIYAGWHTNGTVKESKTADKLLPAAAYLNRDGEIKDMLFDSFTFLPYATASSGRSYVASTTAAASANKTDWQGYIDFLFEDANQIAALNEAVGQAKSALNRPTYKAKVKLAIPKPLVAQTNFGTVNGSALSFNASGIGEQQALANRVAAVKWYVDELLQRWNPERYPHLSFDGFYWLSESVEVLPSNAEESLLQQVNAYIHQNGKMNYWIPFYQANGFYKWKALGFDYAIMQPNYAFYESPDTRPTEAANLAKRFGLGVEIEIHWNGLTVEADRQKFLRYLDQGVTAGYMNGAVRAWYMGTDTLQQAQASAVETQREVYDKTYASIKGAYPAFPDHTAPVTTDDAAPGWHRTDQIVRLQATDDLSGVAKTFIGVDGEPVTEGAQATISQEGTHTVAYYSVDRAGNAEAVKRADVRIDRTAPSFVLKANGITLEDGAALLDGMPISLDLQASDSLSGVAEQALSADGKPVAAGTKIDWAGKLGTHTIGIAVTDRAGNRTEAAIRVIVKTSITSMKQLLNRYEASNELSDSLKKKLEKNLEHAEKDLAKGKMNNAVKEMKDFLKSLHKPSKKDYDDAMQEKEKGRKPKKDYVSDAARVALDADAKALLEAWSGS
ncbi:DUF4855 domain-containing protein [Paenibacillus contaminans]|uniref:FIMAH domain-containing protein n=1 Tax=Paenibacillus contaminans TaxID=450362 RepID=A0A329MKE4_9BACL|nr:DUF4855 domain-containing protein [Paenibacillus contaminans]RAV19786.1 hypothetical protein DQG23_17745 [Paenibacillus contaminans]